VSLKGGKMIQRSQITVALPIVVILLALACPWRLAAQEEKFIDCRERPCDVKDFLIVFQQTRGIPTTAIPAAAIPMRAVALNVYFATNSDRISPKYYAELNKLGEALTQLPSIVEISGHTDSLGSDQLNQLLSERRAQSVKQYLEQHFSLPAERLIAKGYGENQPRTTNATEGGRRQNRRIEVGLLKP
jgi:outer membrane protein OmpA-like peptidoglycan-associated protein